MKLKSLDNANKKNIPWHLWLIGGLFFLIYLVGLYDYFMILTKNQAYMNSLDVPGDLNFYFKNYPLIFNILWTLNVFGGLVAAILILIRTKWALTAAFVTVLSKFLLDILTFSFRNRWDVFGPQIAIGDLIVLIISIGFYFYCLKLNRRGIFKS